MAAGRIGKVRMKATGFEFRVISGPPDPENDIGAGMLRCARTISAERDMVGYLVVGLTADGGYRCGYRWDDTCSPVPRTLFPSYMAELLRRELITNPEAIDVFDSKFVWVD